MAVDLDVHIPILLTVPQPHERVQKSGVGQDAEIDVLADQGQVLSLVFPISTPLTSPSLEYQQSYHESTPLLLPEGTGECKCCSVM